MGRENRGPGKQSSSRWSSWQRLPLKRERFKGERLRCVCACVPAFRAPAFPCARLSLSSRTFPRCHSAALCSAHALPSPPAPLRGSRDPAARPPARRGRRPQAFLPPAGALRARSCWGIRLVLLRSLSPFSRNPRRGSLDGSDHLIQGARWGAEGECRALGRGAGGGCRGQAWGRAHLRWVPCLHGQLLCLLPGGSGWGWGGAQDRTPGQAKDTGNSDLPALGTGAGILLGKEGRRHCQCRMTGPVA